MLAIVIFSLSVTVSKMTTFNLPKWSQFDLENVGHGHEIQHRRVRRWMAFLWPIT